MNAFRHGLRNALVLMTVVFVIIAGCAVFRMTDRNEMPIHSPVSLVIHPDSAKLFIAESAARRITVLDIASNQVVDVFPLPDDPSGLAVSPDGGILYVTCGAEKGRVVAINTGDGRILRSFRTGHTPCSPVLSPDGADLYVCNRFDNTLSVFDAADGTEAALIPMMREPIAAACTPDGRYLFVANHLPTAHQIDAYVTDGGYMDIRGYSQGTQYASKSVVVVVNTRTTVLEAIIQLPEGSNGLKGVCVSPDGRYVYVTHILARYKEPTVSVESGAMNANALSVIDVNRMRLEGTVLLDDQTEGAANPWGVCCSDIGEYLFVAHAGTHEISIIDRAAFHRRLHDTLQYGRDLQANRDSLAHETSYMEGIRRRVNLEGIGPRALACIENHIYAAGYFSDSIGHVRVMRDDKIDVASYPLAGQIPLSEERRGEMLFHDARLCYQSWQSCASCHPDGRMDGLNWDLLNDGEGNPKNTKSLLYSHVTPPAMITGIRPSAEAAVRAGLHHILFQEHDASVAEAIDAYLKSQKEVAGPAGASGKINRSRIRGRRLFRKCGCMECHPPPLYTDMKAYNVGTGRGEERSLIFDTPSLVELWRTAPYLYDGRAISLYEVLTLYNRNDRHGITSDLTYRDLNDLVEFLLSL